MITRHSIGGGMFTDLRVGDSDRRCETERQADGTWLAAIDLTDATGEIGRGRTEYEAMQDLERLLDAAGPERADADTDRSWVAT